MGLESLLPANLGHVGGVQTGAVQLQTKNLQGYQNDWLNQGLAPGLKCKIPIEFTLEQHKYKNNHRSECIPFAKGMHKLR